MTAAAQPRLPDAPALVVQARGAVWLTPEGEIESLDLAATARRLAGVWPLLCHRRAVAARLGLDAQAFGCFDLLELFAFVHPARFCIPTPRGLAEVVGLPSPQDPTAQAETLVRAARRLLGELKEGKAAGRAARAADPAGLAWIMSRHGWPWGPAVLAALGATDDAGRGLAVLRVWERLPEWTEQGGETPAGSRPVDPGEARSRLAAILGPTAEERPSQADYASAASLAFAPRARPGAPCVVLAEAGTGTGKTLAYIAPSSLWAERNGAPVWISTYTRNLQRQLDAELSRLYPDPALKARKVVIRKGRENYLCLLNLEEAVQRLSPRPGESRSGEAITLGLLARWTLATRDGDMVGGDLPGWLVDLLGKTRTLGLADRRGECIFAACPHFRRCFVEQAVRRARRADIVVANHALVMTQAAFGGLDDGTVPCRYVFDEGHHLFHAADSAFSASLSGLEAGELRRWLLGAESEHQRSRARGLKRRCEDLVDGDAAKALDDALHAARALPAPGWHQRLAEGQEQGVCEGFLGRVRRQVLARAARSDGPYGLECEPWPVDADLALAARGLADALDQLARPLRALARALAAQLDDKAAELDSATRQRIEAIVRSIDRRALTPLAAWQQMLGGLGGEASPPELVDWLAVERIDGREVDVAFHRHWIDPTLPFCRFVAEPAHGLLITSATLRDGSGDVEADWQAAERRVGAVHLPAPAVRAAVPSPFDYGAVTRVLIVTDVRKDDIDQVAAAYRELFVAAAGGGLGLFTAVNRLKQVWQRIAAPLDEAGIPLLAQHIGGMDTATVVDIFRAEEDACLLGTDALRDGVDVPGRSLRVIVFDRVPWPRPDILHKARRAAFGGMAYDDMITRLRLKQAFGRLIRRAGDAGVFVLLDRLMPSRLAGAFPPDVTPRRVGLAEAIHETREFLRSEQ
jgi:ATP-dependent DNA helicase DinG